LSAERILIIEDDPEIREMLKFAFIREGWQLNMVSTGEEGLKIIESKETDCIILDIMLPGMDGLKTLKKIRENIKFQTLPVILCTARGEESDIIAGLELGADDYVVKPYSPRILAARIRAALRRNENAKTQSEGSQNKTLRYGKINLDIERHTVHLDKKPLDLFPTEFALLVQFMSNPDIVFSRQRLITAIRGNDYPVTDRSIDVQIMGLRKKLGDSGDMIETIRGIGYRFKTE